MPQLGACDFRRKRRPACSWLPGRFTAADDSGTHSRTQQQCTEQSAHDDPFVKDVVWKCGRRSSATTRRVRSRACREVRLDVWPSRATSGGRYSRRSQKSFRPESGPPLEGTLPESVPKIFVARPLVSRSIPIFARILQATRAWATSRPSVVHCRSAAAGRCTSATRSAVPRG